MRRFFSLLALAIPLALAGSVATPASNPKQVSKVFGVDTYVVGDGAPQFIPGSRASLRVMTMGVTGLTSSQPIPLAQVSLAIKGNKHPEKIIFRGRSDLLGISDANFDVPAWPDGSYEMIVRAKTPFGEGKVERSVTVKHTGKILLVTDKPIYQPGQLVHMRALLLDSNSLRPLANIDSLFEVQDPKGNKVFKKRLKTGAYGVTSADFQLASEINLGNYQVSVACENRSLAEAAQKTLVVKKYVLPKFKSSISTDKDYYLPRQTIKGKIQSDYFFGKPLSGAKVEVRASTFDVKFKEFATLNGRTGKDGSWKFELKLPDYFVGQPLQKGDAVVKLDVKVTDTAKHTEKSIKTVPVAAAPMRLAAVPEGGRIVAGVPNRIYVVASYPDGSPAKARVVMKCKGKEIGKTRTDETGLGLFVVTPLEKEMRDGGSVPRGSFGREHTIFNQPRPYVRAKILDLAFEAGDQAGAQCTAKESFSTDPEGDRVLLRTDKAIYKGGDTIRGSVLTTAGKGSVFLDLIKNRQTLLTRTVALEAGRGSFSIPLGPDAFGTLELHAYQILAKGEIMRDARVLYAQPPRDLSITISQDKSIYRPGDGALIKFKVMDNKGKPASAALGVIVVDEAVYALQEIKPGLEKVYFTLERELTKPKYQIEFGPAEDLASLVKARDIQAKKQQVAKVLLAKAEPAANLSLWSNPVTARLQKAQNDRYIIRNALNGWGQKHPLAIRTEKGKLHYRPNIIKEMVDGKVLTKEQAADPLGAPYTIKRAIDLWPELSPKSFLASQELNRLWNLHSQFYSILSQKTSGFTKLGKKTLAETVTTSLQAALKQANYKTDITGKPYGLADLRTLPGFRVEDLLTQIHAYRAQRIYAALSRYGNEGGRWYRVGMLDKKTNTYILPKNVLLTIVRRGYLGKNETRDIWGRPFQLKKLKKARKRVYYDNRLRFYLVYSTGPDGRAGTRDDLDYSYPVGDGGYQAIAKAVGFEQVARGQGVLAVLGAGGGRGDMIMDGAVMEEAAPMAGFGGIGGLGTRGRGGMHRMPTAKSMPQRQAKPADYRKGGEAGPAAPKKRNVRVRNFFPETLLFEPRLITDAGGAASLKVPLADSITTWRMTVSANAAAGGLGSTSHAVRVFQDFFVDLDLPVALTQNDELSIPVVVYNYLKTPQRVRLELESGDWFTLSGSPVQEIALEPNEVSSTYYRIKVLGLGDKTLQVRADGSNMSDAIRRQIEVLPDGKEMNVVANGRLEGALEKTIDIP
ncbi:MAG TPA: MG2 domain-containing protein, partial [Myxococcota bacterium]|nr:MG2 domain-containing protein [Myxococcota bacterium]